MLTSTFSDFRGRGGVSIARHTPGWFRGEVLTDLAPGEWFNRVSEAEYARRYGEQLAALDPAKVVADLTAAARGREPVLLCFEPHLDCALGKTFCHRHMAARWLHLHTGLIVPEFDPMPADQLALF